MAAGVPIKFRCTQCGRLLGASRSKAGEAVACPKCGMTVFVPASPDPAPPQSSSSSGIVRAPADDPTAGLGPNPDPSTSLDTGIPLDFLDIRPEDIRVEPGARGMPLNIFPPAEHDDDQAPEPELELEPEPESETSAVAIRLEPLPPAAPSTAPEAAPDTPSSPEPSPGPDVVVPPIRLESPGSTVPKTRALLARPHDLVLPRSVVTAWSLFVLLALAMSFVAGLLTGHYLWRTP
jgi:DNA-directed RNA polymerase subunit RPC12/RpoP